MDQLAKDLRAIYTAPSVDAAWAAFEELEWGPLWGEVRQALPGDPEAVAGSVGGVHTVPRVRDVEIRRVLFSTNAIESLDARYRRAVGARGHFPTEQAALKTGSPDVPVGV